MIELTNLKELVRTLKQPMQSCTLSTVKPHNDIIQLKYDGWWCALVYKNGYRYYVTAGADIRKKEPTRIAFNAVFVGEWMYGTNWSQTVKPGSVFIHDVYQFESSDAYQHPYSIRYDFLKAIITPQLVEKDLYLLQNYPVSHAIDTYQEYCIERGFEGLVFKNSAHMWGEPFQRFKKTMTMDYICTQLVEGSGRLSGTLGAIQGGLYVDGKLQSICSVGGGMTDSVRAEIWANPEKYLGFVFEASGYNIFPSGALRHPNFLRWRIGEKSPEECIWIKEHESIY